MILLVMKGTSKHEKVDMECSREWQASLFSCVYKNTIKHVVLCVLTCGREENPG